VLLIKKEPVLVRRRNRNKKRPGINRDIFSQKVSGVKNRGGKNPCPAKGGPWDGARVWEKRKVLIDEEGRKDSLSMGRESTL